MRTHLGAVQHARARGLRAFRIREHAPEAEEQVQPVGFLCVRADGRTDGRRERGAEGRREGTAAAALTQVPEELRVHDLDELLQRRQLLLHAALVAHEILLLRGGGGEPKSAATDRATGDGD